ncbi:hypothetical protein [Acetobacter persici]|uniref:Uncharacterized protein n=1 Tax=Acetobacter persici TaxID=1076596 RepID=A0A6V8IAU8_9PROT|nr:hypothetical protein [Acetobacter persici]OUI91012.1 hypothetical protein HK19_08295 [Acetobacter persici]GFE94710.1 hypothetical protein DmAi_27690 [Acetobacter persici]
MFDEVFGTATMCSDNFCKEVRDAFGVSIVADVLDPILKEINSLCIFNADFQQQLYVIDQILNDVRAFQV